MITIPSCPLWLHFFSILGFCVCSFGNQLSVTGSLVLSQTCIIPAPFKKPNKQNKKNPYQQKKTQNNKPPKATISFIGKPEKETDRVSCGQLSFKCLNPVWQREPCADTLSLSARCLKWKDQCLMVQKRVLLVLQDSQLTETMKVQCLYKQASRMELNEGKGKRCLKACMCKFRVFLNLVAFPRLLEDGC